MRFGVRRSAPTPIQFEDRSIAKLKGFDLDSFEEEAFEPLALNRDVARGKALHMGDVHNLVDVLDDLGFYDKGRHGKPPLWPHVRRVPWQSRSYWRGSKHSQ